MDKKSKEVIREAIEEIIEYRKEEFGELVDHSFGVNKKATQNMNPMHHNTRTLTKYYRTIVKLNNLLKVEDRINLAEEMEKIQAKKIITVKEFSEIYNVSKTSQQNYRSKLYNPLPYHQKVQGGKIVYHVKEVEQWFENQHK